MLGPVIHTQKFWHLFKSELICPFHLPVKRVFVKVSSTAVGSEQTTSVEQEDSNFASQDLLRHPEAFSA